MLRKIRETLKPDGRLVLLEYRAEDPRIPINPEHKMTVAQVKAELEPEGFVLQPVIETLPRQHILILTKAAGQGCRRALDLLTPLTLVSVIVGSSPRIAVVRCVNHQRLIQPEGNDAFRGHTHVSALRQDLAARPSRCASRRSNRSTLTAARDRA